METVIRGVAVYLFLMLILRLSGRRSLAQITSFDFVLLLIIAGTFQQALVGEDFSLTNAAVLVITLVALDVGLSLVKQWSPRASIVLDGSLTVLISRGELDADALRRSRVGLEDVLQAARQQHGLKRLDQVAFAILEVDGSLSIIPSDEAG